MGLHGQHLYLEARLPGILARHRRYIFTLKKRIGSVRAENAAGLRCWAADSQGQIGCIDLTAGKVLHLLKGCAGSVRSLSLHPSFPLVASAGLDRFLRIHDLRSRKSAARWALLSLPCSFPLFLTRGSMGWDYE